MKTRPHHVSRPAPDAEEAQDLIDRPTFDPMHPLHEVGTTLASVAACAAVVAELFVAMLVLTMIAPLVAATLDRFDTSPPPLTAWIVNLPPMGTFLVMVVLMVAMVAKERLMTNKRLTLIINLVLLASSLFWIPLLVGALFSAPWAEVIHSIE